MNTRDQIVEQALQLTADDRAYVVERLEESLPQSGFPSPEIADAWSRELNRRIAAYERGETQSISAEESLRHAREALARQRSRPLCHDDSRSAGSGRRTRCRR